MQPGYYPTGLDSQARQPLGKAFAGSLVTHGVVVGLLLASGLFNLTRKNFGSPNSSSGTVGVSMVKTIPIPQKEAPVNLLANDSTSVVPEAPAPRRPTYYSASVIQLIIGRSVRPVTSTGCSVFSL